MAWLTREYPLLPTAAVLLLPLPCAGGRSSRPSRWVAWSPRRSPRPPAWQPTAGRRPRPSAWCPTTGRSLTPPAWRCRWRAPALAAAAAVTAIAKYLKDLVHQEHHSNHDSCSVMNTSKSVGSQVSMSSTPKPTNQ